MKPKQKQSESISNNITKRKPTPEQRELLINYHNAIVNMPSTEDLMRTFDIDLTKQAIFKAAGKRRYGK